MPTPAWDDLDAFLGDFAVPVVLTMQDGATRTFPAIFDDPYLNAQIGEYEADTSRPRLTCKESDVIGVSRGDSVTIAGRVYDVLTGGQADGTGMAMLDLAAVA
jgi:hypothetical protein